APLPSPSCLELPSSVAFAGCDLPAAACDVTQNACTFQASCAGGLVFGGRGTTAGTRWTNAGRRRRRPTLVARDPGPRKMNGSCTPPAGSGRTACDLTANPGPNAPPPPTCELLAPSFVLSGCGFTTNYGKLTGDAICNVTQRACVWQANCGDNILA